jgi:hypothetical protein
VRHRVLNTFSVKKVGSSYANTETLTYGEIRERPHAVQHLIGECLYHKPVLMAVSLSATDVRGRRNGGLWCEDVLAVAKTLSVAGVVLLL